MPLPSPSIDHRPYKATFKYGVYLLPHCLIHAYRARLFTKEGKKNNKSVANFVLGLPCRSGLAPRITRCWFVGIFIRSSMLHFCETLVFFLGH